MKEKTERNNLIMKMRDKGKTTKEIAQFFNISYWSCRAVIRRMRGEVDGRDYKREQIRKFFNQTCQKCKRVWETKERKFDVHHWGAGSTLSKKYDKEINWEKITLLCHKCHLNLPEHRKTMSEKAMKLKRSTSPDK